VTASPTREFGSRTELPGATADALQRLLVAIADTKLLLGYHYGEWTFGPPELEAAVAGCSMCQTELGHVRLLHGILKSHFGDDPERLVADRARNEFASVAYLDGALTDWAQCVAANFVVDLAVTRLLHGLRASTFTPLRMSIGKMIEEERHHAHHGLGWCRTLATKNTQCHTAMQDCAQQALDSIVEWFGPADDPDDRALVEAGIKSAPNHSILQDFLADIDQTASAVGVRLESRPSPSSAWSPTTRRSTKGGPDDEILYHLRGSKNAIFRL
jgi:ring-1,2-phenylacetyl-CoA epoxidase subunit PaaA